MFMGEYSHTIDAKGRVILPAKFRDELGSSFVVTRGLEGCLSVYTMEAWINLANGMKSRPQKRMAKRAQPLPQEIRREGHGGKGKNGAGSRHREAHREERPP